MNPSRIAFSNPPPFFPPFGPRKLKHFSTHTKPIYEHYHATCLMYLLSDHIYMHKYTTDIKSIFISPPLPPFFLIKKIFGPNFLIIVDHTPSNPSNTLHGGKNFGNKKKPPPGGGLPATHKTCRTPRRVKEEEEKPRG